MICISRYSISLYVPEDFFLSVLSVEELLFQRLHDFLYHLQCFYSSLLEIRF